MKKITKKLLSAFLVCGLFFNILAVPAQAAPASGSASRISGKDRYETCFAIADAFKEESGQETFQAVIIASGKNFADALAGSYLAYVKNAPILMTNGENVSEIQDYISKNMSADGVVYILGGTSAVPENVRDSLEGYETKRLSGASRYETNLKILEEAGVGDESILIATGKSFADSLSASAAKKPILLVGNSLTADQKNFLEGTSGDFYILGGTAAVSAEMEKAIQAYGSTDRLGGSTRYETSVFIAEEFSASAQTAVFAYAKNFPDGLAGGVLAASMNAPMILTATGAEIDAIDYVDEGCVTAGVVLGGISLISDASIREILGLADGTVISKWTN